MADTLEDIRKHVEDLIRRLSEAEAQPVETDREAAMRGPMNPAALDQLAEHVGVLSVKADQAGNLLAQVTDLLESQAERLETLEQQVGEPEPVWAAPERTPEPEPTPEPAPQADLELANMVADLLETVRSEVGTLARELRDRTQGIEARFNDLAGRFDDLRELAWQQRSEMRNLEERLLIVAESSMEEGAAGPPVPVPASDPLPKLAITEVAAPEPSVAASPIIPIASPEIIAAVEGGVSHHSAGEASAVAAGANAAVAVERDVEAQASSQSDQPFRLDSEREEFVDSLEPMDSRTVRRLEELVEREVRLQQEFTPGASVKHGRRTRPSVMVVDDLPDARKILSIYLSRTGYHVVTASGAEDCLAKLRHHRVDAVVLDASMPGGGGAQVCRTLREDPAYAAKRDLPVVIYTAYPDEHPPSVVEAWGATDYVVKGGDMLPLITALVRHTKEEPEAVT